MSLDQQLGAMIDAQHRKIFDAAVHHLQQGLAELDREERWVLCVHLRNLAKTFGAEEDL